MNLYPNTPLFNALINHTAKHPHSFHVPGHKNGTIFHEKAKTIFTPLLSIDQTELSGLDDLHDAETVINEAHTKLANLYGAEKSYFLINGTTVGNLAMLFATVKTDDTILVQKNCHKSVMNAIALIGAKPVFITPEIEEQTETAAGLSFRSVEEALQKYNDAKALVLTHPSYYGISRNISDIVQLAHTFNVPVLVDEAHGAHYTIGDPFPKSALEYGADIVVQSAHKTLPAMTMGSYLHINKGSLVRSEHIEHFLQTFQSSSPSYPIMASLDLARDFLETFPAPAKIEIIEARNKLTQQLESECNLKVIKQLSLDGYELDPLKLIIQSKEGWTGFQLQEQLEQENIYVELADPRNVLFVLPLAAEYNYDDLCVKIKRALKGVEKVDREVRINKDLYSTMPSISNLVLSYREMETKRTFETELEDAVGKISAEAIIPYPPGIPLILPGERITEQQLELIKVWQYTGARFQGSNKQNKIKVFND